MGQAALAYKMPSRHGSTFPVSAPYAELSGTSTGENGILIGAIRLPVVCGLSRDTIPEPREKERSGQEATDRGH